MLLITLLHLSYFGMGLPLLRLLFKEKDYPSYLRYPISYFIGVFIHIIVIHVSIIAGSTSALISWSLLMIGMIGLSWEIWSASRLKSLKLSPVRSSKGKLALNIGIFVLLIPVLYLITLKLAGLPDVGFDTTAIWNLKAKYFFYGEHQWAGSFLDTHRVHPHKNYPLYMPIFVFEHFSIIGVADDYLTKYGTWIYYSIGVILYCLIIRQWTGTTIALLTIAFMLYSPLYSYRSLQGSITTTHIDFPLSLMIAASAGLLMRYQFFKNPVDIFSSAIFLASAVLQKREGIAWLMLFLLFALLALVVERKKLWDKEYAWLALPVFFFLFWTLIKAFIPYEQTFPLPKLEELDKLLSAFPKIIVAWKDSILDVERWGLLPIFVIPFFIIGCLRNIREVSRLAPAFMVVGYLGAIFYVFMRADLQGEFEAWMRVTYHRLIIHILPLSLLLSVVMNSSKFTNGLFKNHS